MSSEGRRRSGRHGLAGAVVGVVLCVVIAAPAWAYASRSARTITVPSGRGPVFRSATTRCPQGQHVMFGGYKNGVAGMRRTADDRWTVDGFNLGGPALKLTAYAYCGGGPVASKHTRTVSVTSSGSATAKCPAGKVVLAGGFATSNKSVFAATRLERTAPNAWQVSGYLRYGITKRTALTAIAYCGTGPAPTAISKTVSLSKDGGRSTVACPTGKMLTFGGMVVRPAKPKTALVLLMRVEGAKTWAVANSTAGKLTSIAYCR
jgi:hypothetical protein